MNEKRNWGMRKLDFLKWNAAIFFYSGYQICSDTILKNMTVMEIKEENLKCNCIHYGENVTKWEKLASNEVVTSMYIGITKYQWPITTISHI
jgi:hypothetical protein